MRKQSKKEVSVFVTTYNHKDYIAQALDSILMQKVSFLYEIIIHDDASTDGTTEIVQKYAEKYPEKIRVRCQIENQYSQGNLTVVWDSLMSMCTGKYCALLDGDDYWSDEKKLQRQYDYMEAHPECSLYIHNAERLDIRTGEVILLNTFSQSGYYSQREQVICGLGSKFPALGSYFFLMDYIRKDVPDFIFNAGIGDYPIRQLLANKGSVYYDERPMSVYRYMTNGSFMKRIQEDVSSYVTYISRITRFYHELNKYTNYQFEDIFVKKINSDILGLATATYDNRELVKSGKNDWLTDKLGWYYELLSGKKWVERIKSQIRKDESVWIYGTSPLAAICKRCLGEAGISINGFVVSDGYGKLDSYKGYVVKYLRETCGKEAFYVIASQQINEDSIEKTLEQSGEKRYYYPYGEE